MKTIKENEAATNQDEVELKPLLEKIEFTLRLMADLYVRCFRSTMVVIDEKGIFTIVSLVLSSSVNVIHQLRVPSKLSQEICNSRQREIGSFYVLHAGPFVKTIEGLVIKMDASIKTGEDKYEAYAKYQRDREVLISNTSCRLADGLIRIYNANTTAKL